MAISLFGLQFGNRRTNASQPYSFDVIESTRTGETITPERALRNATVFSCINVIADSIAQLDWGVYRDGPDGAVRVTNYAVLNRVLRMPNDVSTPYEFKHAVISDMLLHGNAYILVTRTNAGDVVSMTQLDPSKVVVRLNAAGRPTYEYRENGNNRNFNRGTIVHLRDYAANYLEGKSRIECGAELIAQSNAIEALSADVFKNGNALSGVITADQAIAPETQKQIIDAWKAKFTGRGNDRAGITVLGGGLRFEQTQFMKPTDADLIELKKYVDAKICGLFRVPTSFLEISDSNKYNNVSQKQTSFYRDTLAPMLASIEQRLTADLVADPALYIKFDTTDIQRGDLTAQTNIAVSKVRNGIMTPNEAREFLSLPRIEGGDELIVPGAAPDMVNQEGTPDDAA